MNERLDHWFAVSVTVAPEYSEAAEFAFNELDSLGSEVDLLSKNKSKLCTVTAYFAAKPDDESINFYLKAGAQAYGLSPDIDFVVRHSVVDEKDWLAEWKRYWKPTVVGKFVIAAPWHEVNDADRVVIRIEPNMAFGTGTHETTQLCLESISESFRPDQSFLDVGTGTGILAIAAAKLSSGNERFLAIDNDSEAVAIATTNAALNETQDRIDFLVGFLDSAAGSFDFVCANLTADVIVPILPGLLAKTNETLVMSGILAEQEGLIVSQIPKSFPPLIRRSGEWISVIINKT